MRKFTAFLRHAALLSVLFSTKFHLFHNFIFFPSNNMFFTNYAQTFKYHSCLKDKADATSFITEHSKKLRSY